MGVRFQIADGCGHVLALVKNDAPTPKQGERLDLTSYGVPPDTCADRVYDQGEDGPAICIARLQPPFFDRLRHIEGWKPVH